MSKQTQKKSAARQLIKSPAIVPETGNAEVDLTKMPELPMTYQALISYVEQNPAINVTFLRQETMLRIEKITGIPLICYVGRTHDLTPNMTAHIEDSDMIGFDDLVQSTEGSSLDVYIMSNGGVAETAERIVKLMRERFQKIRFILPANAYSAATLMCLSGDEIIMAGAATLGPIDPQIDGIPTRTILRAFERMKEQLKIEGPSALAAYVPLISKYDLHTLEICRSAEELSAELAQIWLSSYMLKCKQDDPRVEEIVKFFASYDTHKSHARGIDRSKAKELGLNVINTETIPGLAVLVRSLRNQYAFWFDKTGFFKMYENARGINWGRQVPPTNPPK